MTSHETHEHPHDDEVGIPALLRASRGAYGHAIRRSLGKAGLDDLPRNGAFVIGGIGNHGVPAAGLVRQLGVTKQAASQLIDTLVVRGYLDRTVNPDDRRRLTIELTDRGRAAAVAIRDAVVSIDEELARLCTPEQLAGLRSGLTALCDIRDRYEDEARAGIE